MSAVLSFILTFIGNVVIFGFGAFILLIAMNGFSEKQAEIGMTVYYLPGLLTIILLAVLSIFGTRFIVKKWQVNQYLAALIASFGFVFLNLIIDFVLLVISILLTELNRSWKII